MMSLAARGGWSRTAARRVLTRPTRLGYACEGHM